MSEKPEKNIDSPPESGDGRRKQTEIEARDAEMANRASFAKSLGKVRLFVLPVAAIVPLLLLLLLFLELFGVTSFLRGVGDTPKSVFISATFLSFIVLYAALLRIVFTPLERSKELPGLKPARQIPPNADDN